MRLKGKPTGPHCHPHRFSGIFGLSCKHCNTLNATVAECGLVIQLRPEKDAAGGRTFVSTAQKAKKRALETGVIPLYVSLNGSWRQ
jgi:hypothetical protein